MIRILLLFSFLLLLFAESEAQLNNRIINMDGCGLQIVKKSVKVTTRYPTPAGTGLPSAVTINELPSSCLFIEKAYIWSILSYNAASPDPITFTITNPANSMSVFTGQKTGEKGTKCWTIQGEKGTRGYRADITSAISGNGQYTINVNSDVSTVDGYTIIIVYKDKRASYQGHLVVMDGLITVNSDPYSQSSTLTGINACQNASAGDAFVVVSDIQDNQSTTFSYTANGLTTTPPSLFWNTSDINTNITQGQSNIDFNITPVPDCYSWILAGYYYQTTNCMTCPDELLNVNASSDKNSVCQGSPVQLNASGGGTYTWTSNPPGFNSNLPNPVVTPMLNTTYQVAVVSADNCMEGSGTVLVNVFPSVTYNSNNKEVCLGSSVQIGSLAGGGTPPFTYKWTPAAGLSNPNIAQPTANPLVTTTYTVNILDQNGCTANGNVTVTVNPLPKANPGKNVSTCLGTPIQIGTVASAGTPGYTYQWTPATGLSATNLATVMANPAVTTTYHQRVIDSKGCTAVDSVTVTILPLPQPIITPLGPTTFCSCDSLRLDAGNLGYTAYQWSTGATSRIITVRNTGTFTVTVTDTNGCKNISPPISTTVIVPTATISLPDTARVITGQFFNMPVKLRDTSNLEFCKVHNFTATFKFHTSVMVPVSPTPSGTIIGTDRFITISGTRTDSTLATLNFEATLGDTEFTKLTINSFNWTDCPFTVRTDTSGVRITNLCKQGGITRYFISPSLLDIIIKPNPAGESAELAIKSTASQNISVYMTDLLGRKVKEIFNGEISAGDNDYNVDLSKLANGTYNLIMQSASGIVTKLVEVQK